MKFIIFIISLIIIAACDNRGLDRPTKTLRGALNQSCNDNFPLCDPGLQCSIDLLCTPLPEKTLSIATYNVYDFANENAYTSIAHFIYDFNIDLIIFQEIQPEDEMPLTEALLTLDVDMPHVAFSQSGGYGDDYIAIFSRFPIINPETILTETYTDPVSNNQYDMYSLRPVLKATITPFDTPMTLYGAHLKAQYPYNCNNCIERRRAQAHALESYIKEYHTPEHDLIVIGGDINSATSEDFDPNSTLDILTFKSDNPENIANDFTPVNVALLPKSTSTHHRYSSRLDHLILSPMLYQKYIDRSVIVPETYGSDHKPVLLRINLN